MDLKEVYDVLIDAVENGIDEDSKFDYAVRRAAMVVLLIHEFLDEYDYEYEVSLGSEWLYQDKKAQVRAIEAIANIIDNI